MAAPEKVRPDTTVQVRKASRWVRVANSSVMTDTFLIAAVTTIVLTRSYLAATGFPQVGGNGLHVSHMLWGGLLMTIALFVAILTMGRWNRVPMAVVGGIGFGLFVDEIGKYITSDNDYFFKPTFAMIYLVLVGLYFLTKVALAPRPLKPQEYVLNAIDFLPDAAIGRLNETQKTRALYRLHNAADEPLAAEVRALIERIEPVADGHGPLESFRHWYREQRESEGIRTVLTLWFLLQVALLLTELVVVTIFVQGAWNADDADAVSRFAGDSAGLSAIMLIAAATTLVCCVMTGVAIRRLRRGLHPAYRAFENSLLLSIFVTQVLAFFESWVVAVFALCVTVPAWAILRVLVDEEGNAEAQAALGKTPS